jgi:hypothetical protein
LAFGHVELSVTGSLILGSVPAVLIGSLLSSSVPDRYVRPAIAFVIFASGLKYVGVATTALGWILCATLLVAGVGWLVYARPMAATGGRFERAGEVDADAPDELADDEHRALAHE